MKCNKIIIEYSNSSAADDSISVEYKILDHPLAIKWANIANIVNQRYIIDGPDKFYNIENQETQVNEILTQLNRCIDTINTYLPIIDRSLTSINDQDTLNYLHHQFEIYHGFLNKQDNNEFWADAPIKVRRALSNLNIFVHKCEIAQRNYPAHQLVTWYNAPRFLKLKTTDYNYFQDIVKEGTICLLYSDIGKPLEALAEDNDYYISESAFIPFTHYGPDFIVFLDPITQELMNRRVSTSLNYYNKNINFFTSRGYSWNVLRKSLGFIPVAVITNVNILSEIKKYPFTKSIQFF